MTNEQAYDLLASKVSTSDEQVALDQFWAMFYGPTGPSVALKVLARVKLRRPSSWDRLAVRAEGVPRGLLRGQQCDCCKSTSYRLYWHHVIWIQNGGSAHPRNFVSICHSCHRAVHPWLKEGNTLEQREGPYDIADIIPVVWAKLQAQWAAAQEKSA